MQTDSPAQAVEAAELSAMGATPAAAPELAVIDREARARLDKLGRDVATLVGRRDALIQRETALTTGVAEAKGRAQLKSEVEGVLEELQRAAHERSVGSFERMLTAIAHDVDPTTQVSIKLAMTTERNMPALDISGHVGGMNEAITSGAMQNVVGTGLRFITLARSGRRRFIQLDESDCWISSGEAVQNFFNVVNRLSLEAGIQTLIVTHHDLSEFQEDFRIYRVSEVSSNDAWPRRATDLVSPGRMDAGELQEDCLSFVQLENFENYTADRIELSPGVTAIVGPNGRGKSSWARALRAAFLGESNEDNIRHGKASASVAVGFADGRVLKHTRRAKGSPAAEYVMHSPESWAFAQANPATWMKDPDAPKPLHHSPTARLPEWVPKETGVAEVDGINVQLWPQLSPVFMLDQSPSKRASLLSVGRESGHLFAMNEIYKDDLRADASIVRDGEKEIAAIRGALQQLQPLESLHASMDALRAEGARLIAEVEDLRAASELIRSMEVLQAELAHLERYKALGELAMPEVKKTDALIQWLERVEEANALIRLRTDLQPIELPALYNTTVLEEHLRLHGAASADAALAGAIPKPIEAPGILQTQELTALVEGMERAAADRDIKPPLPLPDAQIAPTSELQGLLLDIERARIDAAIPTLTVLAEASIKETAPYQSLIAEIERAREDSEVRAPAPLETPSMQSTAELGALIADIERTQRELNGYRAQELALREEQRTIELTIEKAVEVLGNECPTCNQHMDADMILGHLHEHDDSHDSARERISP